LDVIFVQQLIGLGRETIDEHSKNKEGKGQETFEIGAKYAACIWTKNLQSFQISPEKNDSGLLVKILNVVAKSSGFRQVPKKGKYAP
jgi:hypothetical protein